jgi:hypothetical protein
VAYWLAVYSPTAWEKTRRRKADRAAFPVGLKVAVRVAVGDRLVCYVQQTRTFAGLLEVTGDLEEKPDRRTATRDVGDPMLPLRLPTAPVVTLKAEKGIPARALQEHLEFVREGTVSVGRRATLTRIPVTDARRLEELLRGLAAEAGTLSAAEGAPEEEIIFGAGTFLMRNGGGGGERRSARAARPVPRAYVRRRRGYGAAPRTFAPPPGPRRARARRTREVDETVRRTPHLDLPSEPVEPASEFDVAVWVDKEEPREGEIADSITLRRDETLVLDVRLVTSRHFSVRGRAVRKLTVHGDRARSRTLRFTVAAASSFVDLREATIAAYFTHGGDPAGMVRRVVTIAGVAAPERRPRRREPPRERAVVAVPVSRKQPDLTVTVRDPQDDLRQLHCTVQTPHLRDYAKGRDEDWPLPKETGEYVLDRMGDFIDTETYDAEHRRAALLAAGVEFFNTSPSVFRNAFWRLVEAKRLRTILIMSEDPNIPWELMVPTREGDPELYKPLGVEFAVGRWVAGDNVAPPQAIVLRDCYVVAPETDLPSAPGERNFVLSILNGKAIDPATIEALDRELGRAGVSLIHVVTHADSAGDAPGGDDMADEDPHRVPNQILLLEDDKLLASYMLLGYAGIREGMVSRRPFVFLNACEIGRTIPSLVGVGGFADVLIELSASAVVAPVWAVEDDIAFNVAKSFYETARKSPRTPAAKILARLRGRAYRRGHDFDDSYAAYCFYGDPLATIAFA